MSDRRRVVYKTPLQRVSEIALVLLFTFGLTALSHAIVPGVSTQIAILPFLILSYLAVPILGSQLALRRGAALLTVEERTRRYLRELGPIGLGDRPGAVAVYSGRRTAGRSLRRG